jgi:hypothetical protein
VEKRKKTEKKKVLKHAKKREKRSSDSTQHEGYLGRATIIASCNRTEDDDDDGEK